METKIDIAAILKDKPKNIKLYSPIFGDVYFFKCRGWHYKSNTSGKNGNILW